MTKEQLKPLIAEYLATRDDTRREEQWETDRTYARWELEAFVEWLNKRPAAEPTQDHEETVAVRPRDERPGESNRRGEIENREQPPDEPEGEHG